MRSLCLFVFGCLVGLTVYTYDLKIKTRALEVTARDLTTALQDESDFLALMRAEVSYLSRPERIQSLAKTTLHLEPMSQSQLVPWSVIAPQVVASSWAPEVVTSRPKEGIAALIDRSNPTIARIQDR